MSLKHIRIHTKLLMSYLVVILFTVSSIGYLAYRISTNEIITNTEGFSNALIEQLAINVPNRAKHFEQSTYAIQNDKEFMANLSQDASKQTTQQTYLNQINIHSFLSNFLGLSQDIRAILLITKSGQLYWSEEVEYFGRTGQLNEQDAANKMEAILSQLQQHTQAQSMWIPGEHDGEIVFVRQLINPATLDHIGHIAFVLDEQFLRTIPEEWTGVTGTVAILNRHNQLLYADESASEVIASWIEHNSNQRQSIIQQEGGQYLVFYQTSENHLWNLLFIVPISELFRASDELKLSILLTSFAALVVTALIAIGISRHVTGNIRKLERTMRRVEEGNFSIQVNPTSRDEIGLLGLRFNAMVKRINDLIQRLYVEQMAKQQAEFQVLKAQINPHFLYNTLGSILWLARMHNQHKIAQMIKSLIELLKISVRKTSEYITVEEEINYIDNYLEIQKFRFENRFRVEYDVDESIKHVQMLNFILQPLVENALLHGIEMSKGAGWLAIRAYREEHHLKLEVEDNGCGMSEQQISELLGGTTERDSYPGLHSIGIYNVNARIKLYYGQEYGLRYRSSPGQGTLVTIELPLQRPGGNEHAERDDR